MRMSAEDWRAVIDTNLTGAFFVSRAALRGMLRRRSGSIVAVSSIVGLTATLARRTTRRRKRG